MPGGSRTHVLLTAHHVVLLSLGENNNRHVDNNSVDNANLSTEFSPYPQEGGRERGRERREEERGGENRREEERERTIVGGKAPGCIVPTQAASPRKPTGVCFCPIRLSRVDAGNVVHLQPPDLGWLLWASSSPG